MAENPYLPEDYRRRVEDELARLRDMEAIREDVALVQAAQMAPPEYGPHPLVRQLSDKIGRLLNG